MNSSVIDQQTLQFGRLLHYAGLAVVLVVGATTYSWLYSPLVNSITETQLQIEDLEIMSRNTPVIRAEHSRLTEHLQEIEQRYAALEARVPLNAEAGNFLRQVSQIAQDQQLAISNFQPAQTTRSDGYAAMEVRLEGQGTFPSICSFFGRLA
jgi:Tfp pilus assembly protein PilO